MDNQAIAIKLRELALELDAERGNLYRVRAYRQAAQVIEELDEPVTAIFERGGREALEALPHVGPHIAAGIEHLLYTGDFAQNPAAPAA